MGKGLLLIAGGPRVHVGAATPVVPAQAPARERVRAREVALEPAIVVVVLRAVHEAVAQAVVDLQRLEAVRYRALVGPTYSRNPLCIATPATKMYSIIQY